MGSFYSNRMVLCVIAAIFFIAACIGLAYQNDESWDIPVVEKPAPDSHEDGTSNTSQDENKTPPASAQSAGSDASASASSAGVEDDSILQFYLKDVMSPSTGVDQSPYYDFGAFKYELPEQKLWKKPLGKDFCIIDIDNRPWSEEGQLWSDKYMSWDNPEKVHGLSLGVLNHWLYAKIHGYKYYFVEFEAPSDRRASWAKPSIISEILKHHDACVFMDSDAVVHHLDLPFEWLMNYWKLHPTTNSLALPVDPDLKKNMDKFGSVYFNTGFIVLQNNKKAFEILDAWTKCPDEGGDHPECVNFRTNSPGSPTDQAGFGTYIRYDFPAPDIVSLPCDEANGFPESETECSGKFIQHLWTGKETWIKVLVGKMLPGRLLELFHKKFLEEKSSFWYKESDLKSLGAGKMGGSTA